MATGVISVALLYVLVNLVVDISYAVADPRRLALRIQIARELLECLGYFTKLWNERVNAECYRPNAAANRPRVYLLT